MKFEILECRQFVPAASRATSCPQASPVRQAARRRMPCDKLPAARSPKTQKYFCVPAAPRATSCPQASPLRQAARRRIPCDKLPAARSAKVLLPEKYFCANDTDRKSHSLEMVLNRSKTASKISIILVGFKKFEILKFNILNCGQFVPARPRRECVARCIRHTLCSSAVKLAT